PLSVRSPTFLFRRFTDGVYYEVCDETGFDAAFGKAFQAYIGDVIHAADTQSAFSIMPEAPYSVGKDQRHTVDWLVEDTTAVMFIEAKTKRLRFDAKVNLAAGYLEDELEKMSNFIIQVYKTIEDYREGRYPVAWDGQKRIYPLIVTLEEWFLFGPEIFNRIDSRVRTKLATEALSVQWTDEMPYTVCAIDDLEVLLQVVSVERAAPVVGGKAASPEFRQWAMRSFLLKRFPEQV